MFFPRRPVLLIDISGVQKPLDHTELLEGFDNIGLQMLVIAPRESFPKITSKNLRYVDTQEKSEAMQAADFVIALNGEAEEVRKARCVPIAAMNGDGTSDYNPIHEKGNGFYFKNPTKWEIFAAVIRAMETYKFPYDWENLMREILS